MELSNKCILCGGSNVYTIDQVNLNDLRRLYKFRRKIDVNRYFNNKESIDLNSCKDCGLIYYSPAFQGDGSFYSQIQDKGYYLVDKQEYREASNFITAENKVLDIGCGIGNFSKLIKSKMYTGLEFNPKAIEIARLNGINVLNESVQSHSKKFKNYYDIVCYFQVLEHIEQPDEFIQDSINCLKKGGKLIFAVPSEDTYCGTIVNNYLNYPPHHVTRWRDSVFNKISLLYKLKLESIIHEEIHATHASFYVRTLIFNKIRSIFGMKKNILDISIFSTFLYVISYFLGFLIKPFYYFFNKTKPFGQSVIVIYTKENDFPS